MVILENDKLTFRFPEIHEKASCTIKFLRTLRVPDDNRDYPLPAGLGHFLLSHVEDFAAKLPPSWPKRGGVFYPMYQSEAMWIDFGGKHYPFAVKIAAGKINAVTGAVWSNELCRQPQDYVVVPRQHYLDGFSVQKGLIRQFVAMPLGREYSAEEQITGNAQFGGLQIIVYPMKLEFAKKYFPEISESLGRLSMTRAKGSITHLEMGLAPGGLVRQQIYEDDYDYGENVWETSIFSRCFVHLLNSEQYRSITGHQPPTEPLSAIDYTKAGLPWFDYYDSDRKPLMGSKFLSGLFSIGAKQVRKGEHVISDTEVISTANIIKLSSDKRSVADGSW